MGVEGLGTIKKGTYVRAKIICEKINKILELTSTQAKKLISN